MMCAREDFGVGDVMRAADAVSCRCGDAGCVLPPQPGEVVRYRVEDVVSQQADPKGEENEPRD